MSATCTDLTLTCIETYASTGESIHFLTMLFGSWVQQIFGDGTTVTVDSYTMTPVMAMIGALNVVGLFYASILVVYNGSHMTLNAAATGNAFGKMNSFVLLRVGIALASISPAIVGTYSFISTSQVIGMYIITRGTGAADLIWRIGVSSFVNYTASSSMGMLAKSTFSPGENLTQMMVCTHYLHEYDNKVDILTVGGYKGNAYATKTVSDFASLTYSQLSDYFAEKSSSSTSTNRIESDYSSSAIEIQFANGDCGGIVIPLARKTTTSSSAKDQMAYYANRMAVDATLNYLRKMYTQVSAILSLVKTADKPYLINALRSADTNSDTSYGAYLDTNLRTALSGIYNAHVNLGYCQSQIINDVVSNTFTGWQGTEASLCGSTSFASTVSATSTVDELTKGGWIMAATAINKMNGLVTLASQYAAFNEKNTKEYLTPFQTKFCKAGFWKEIFGGIENDKAYTTLKEEEKAASNCYPYWATKSLSRYIWDLLQKYSANHQLGQSTDPYYWATAQQALDWNTYVQMTKNTPVNNTSGENKESTAVSISRGILSGIINNTSFTNNLSVAIQNEDSSYDYKYALYDTSGQTNAMAVLTQLGEGLKVIHLAVVVLKAGADQMSDTLANKSVLLSGLLGTALRIFSMYVGPLVMSSLSGAFILANIVPIIPIVMMLFIVIAFLLTCAEALAGISIGAALLASASGDGLLAVHGMRMAALYGAIMLRPALHIIGLMLGYSLTNLALALLNAVWWSSLNNTNTMDIFDLALLTGGYPIIAFLLLAYCFKAANLFPNNLMTWVATEAIGAFGDSHEYVQATQGAFNKLSGAFDSAMAKSRDRGSDKPGGGNGGGGHDGDGGNSGGNSGGGKNGKTSNLPASTTV